MSTVFRLIILLLLSNIIHAQTISGVVKNTDNDALPGVLIYNITTKARSYSQSDGRFQITASTGEELRFIRNQYSRVSEIISGLQFLEIKMDRLPTEIQEVVINQFKLSGDLKQDSKMLTRVDKKEQLRQEIGLPKGPEKPREKPAELKNVLVGVLFGQLNVQGAYDLISGDARRQKALYRYEDQQENIQWVIGSFGEQYFLKSGIPKEKISEYINFSFGANPDLMRNVQLKNFSGAMMTLEKTLPQYLARIKT